MLHFCQCNSSSGDLSSIVPIDDVDEGDDSINLDKIIISNL